MASKIMGLITITILATTGCESVANVIMYSRPFVSRSSSTHSVVLKGDVVPLAHGYPPRREFYLCLRGTLETDDDYFLSYN